jgi:tetratricopeptide (TPR) repeat protein
MRNRLAPIFFLLATSAFAHDDGVVVGKVTFPTSCDPKVEQTFETAVAMLHSYWFPQAEKTFNAVLKDDPQCAIAYWGLAVTNLDNSLAFPPSAKQIAQATEALQKGRAIGAKTERERDWIESIGAYYKDVDTVPIDDRLAAYTKALEQMTLKYPDDFEVWAFYALMLQSSASKNDRTYANQRKSAQILEKLVAKAPEHPGAAHYLIHAYDFPPLAQQGVPVAGKYAKIAPAAPHARHMPSHIYSMVGMWEESIVSNRSALDARPDYFHAMDFMTYAYLQLGQEAKARAMIEEMREVSAKMGVNSATAIASIPARYPLERGDWKGAAALPVTQLKAAQADSLTRFARGIGMARSGDLAGARAEIEALKELKASLDRTSKYWAARTEEQMYAVSAWIAKAEGDVPTAEKLMKAAADGEDASVKNVAMENRLYPLREMLGDLLLEDGKPTEALRTYEVSMKETPNRYRGLYGAAMAAHAAGDDSAARKYYDALVALSKNADGQRPELARAKQVIATR